MIKKRVVLHIGLHKTATTSIQDTFNQYVDELSDIGLFYPQIRGFKEDQVEPNHGRMFRNLYGTNPHRWNNNIRMGIDSVEQVEHDKNHYQC